MRRARTTLASAALLTLVVLPAGCVQQADPSAVRPPDVVVTPGPLVVRALPPAPAAPVPDLPEDPAATDPPADPADPAGPGAPGGPAAPAPETSAAAEARVLELANAARAEAGLAPLQRMTALDDVARAWSSGLAAQGASLGHNPSYTGQYPGGWSAAAENVAWAPVGYASSPSALADAIHAMWMDSDGHRANLLGPYTHVGVGVAYSPEHGWYLTQNFAAY